MAIGAVFPGQGAQSVGMLAELAQAHSSVEQKFSQASDVLGRVPRLVRGLARRPLAPQLVQRPQPSGDRSLVRRW